MSGNYKRAYRYWKRYPSFHESPNAGHPEAAFAGCLGLSFGGWHRYFNKKVFRVPMGDDERIDTFTLQKGLLLSKMATLLFILTAESLALLL